MVKIVESVRAGNDGNGERGADKCDWYWNVGLVVVGVREGGAIASAFTSNTRLFGANNGRGVATEARDAVAVTPVLPQAKEGVGRRGTISRAVAGMTGTRGYTAMVGSGDQRI